MGTLSGSTSARNCLTSASSCGHVLCCMPGYVLKSTLVKPAPFSGPDQSEHGQHAAATMSTSRGMQGAPLPASRALVPEAKGSGSSGSAVPCPTRTFTFLLPSGAWAQGMQRHTVAAKRAAIHTAACTQHAHHLQAIRFQPRGQGDACGGRSLSLEKVLQGHMSALHSSRGARPSCHACAVRGAGHPWQCRCQPTLARQLTCENPPIAILSTGTPAFTSATTSSSASMQHGRGQAA